MIKESLTVFMLTVNHLISKSLREDCLSSLSLVKPGFFSRVVGGGEKTPPKLILKDMSNEKKKTIFEEKKKKNHDLIMGFN